MPLKKEDKEYKFINKPDHWYVDLLEISNDMYLESRFPTQFIILFYEAARRRIYIQTIDNKSTVQTNRALANFLEYTKTLSDQYIEKITSDDGNEFKGEF